MAEGTRFRDLAGPHHSIETKNGLVEQMYREEISMREFCSRHNVNLGTLAKYKRSYDSYIESGLNLIHGNTGRPQLIDRQGMENLQNKLKSAVRSQRAP